LKPYLYTFSLYENPSFIIFSAETEYISTRSWYRNKPIDLTFGILTANRKDKDIIEYVQNLIQPTISLEMPVPSQGHYGFPSFPVVD
jgi:hypothetical protein